MDRLDISDEEKFLVLSYRAASHDLRRAALRVLLGNDLPPTKNQKNVGNVKIKGDVSGQVAGRIVNKGK